jgi:16S rRNA (guanine527-N7)-methyltransferase
MPRGPALQAISGDRIAKRLQSSGPDLTGGQLHALADYLNLLQRWNRVYNLTGVRDPVVMVDRHLLESLALLFVLRGDAIADVGSGAGLPGIPLAIAAPERRFTLIESRAKRVHFLRHVIGELKLHNATVAHCRVEDFHSDAPFDTVLARAVVGPAELAAITRHVTRPGSILLLLTAAQVAQDVAEEPTALPEGFVTVPITDARAATAIAGTSSSIVQLERRA